MAEQQFSIESASAMVSLRKLTQLKRQFEQFISDGMYAKIGQEDQVSTSRLTDRRYRDGA